MAVLAKKMKREGSQFSGGVSTESPHICRMPMPGRQCESSRLALAARQAFLNKHQTLRPMRFLPIKPSHRV
ncbi:hypothetical protein ABGV49_22510 [Chromobacterium vaccinii]|uniref:Uncharacterized protein n=1 Tax=Chromobacterium vaccinii TaxID=1108595 RepID=A0ABV0FIA8_9NEIS